MAILYFSTHMAMFLCFLSILYASFGIDENNNIEQKNIIRDKIFSLKERLFTKKFLPKKALLEAISKINTLLLILF